jgi:FkbM family methyltransferase
MLLRLLRTLSNRRSRAPAASPSTLELTLEQYESLLPAVTIREGASDVTYCTPNSATRWRVDTLFTKEPDTIEWIRGFEDGDILLDIGANVGMYSIFAAKTRGVRVYAFEPESQNYALLYKNIVLNGVSDLVTGYCAALSDEEIFSLLYLSNFHLGGSCHTFGAALDPHLRERESEHTQGCFSTTLDKLVQQRVLPVPTHVKIDVDGFEHKVIDGCRNTLADPRVKSVLVEINTNLPEHRRVVEDMAARGFSCSASQVESAIRQEGPFKGVGNHVFRR